MDIWLIKILTHFLNYKKSVHEIFLDIDVSFNFWMKHVVTDCFSADSEAHDAYRDAKRAYNSNDLESCQLFACKAFGHWSYAEGEVSSCN